MVETYLGLACSWPGTTISRTDERVFVSGEHNVSFCNFVARFQVSESRVEALAEELREHAAATPSFWVFLSDCCAPDWLERTLFEKGFDLRHRLVQMAWCGGPILPHEKGEQAVDLRDREATAKFMSELFFWRSTQSARMVVQRSTSHSPHRLYQWRDEQGTRVGVLVSESKDCLGLYNLCVRTDSRGLGLGTEAIRFVQSLASAENRKIILQCQPNMMPWYEKAGFRQVGYVDALTHSPITF